MENKDKIHYNKVKKILKTAGFAISVLGFVLAIIGFVDFFISIAKGEMPTLFCCLFIGITLSVLGIGMLVFGYKKEISGNVKNEDVPIINEVGKELTPAIRAISSFYLAKALIIVD